MAAQFVEALTYKPESRGFDSRWCNRDFSLTLSFQRPSQATGMALLRCILGKFTGVVCHCFPPRLDVPTFAARCLWFLPKPAQGLNTTTNNNNILAGAIRPWGRLTLEQKWVTGIFTGPKRRGVIVAGVSGWQPYHFYMPIVLKSGSPSFLETVLTCTGIDVTF